MLIPSIAEAFGGLLAAVTMSETLADSKSLQLVVWIPAVFLLAQMLAVTGNWSIRYIVITSERMILISGWFSRKVKVIPLPRLAGMTLERSGSGRLLGYGTFVDESDGRRRIICDYVPYPEQAYLILSGMLFPTAADDEDDVEPPRLSPADD
jgi:Bacterial PH domain